MGLSVVHGIVKSHGGDITVQSQPCRGTTFHIYLPVVEPIIEALELFRFKPGEFDLVVTDQTMPNMTGADLAVELLRIRHDIPIILCTGFSHTIMLEKAGVPGIREFLMKPVVGTELGRIVRRVLDKTPKVQRHRQA